jgi:mobilome CxxCx(11)CxxC protein
MLKTGGCMLNHKRMNLIRQKRMDALATKQLHGKYLSVLNRRNFLVDIFALGVPILYFPIRYAAKGLPIGTFVETFWEGLAAILIFLAVIKIVFRWQDKAIRHSKLSGENISIASHADQLLLNIDTTSLESFQWFIRLADDLEKEDRELIGQAKTPDKQWAYREALKEFTPSSTELCPECGANPWNFNPGTCQLCGNTPALNLLKTN